MWPAGEAGDAAEEASRAAMTAAETWGDEDEGVDAAADDEEESEEETDKEEGVAFVGLLNKMGSETRSPGERLAEICARAKACGVCDLACESDRASN